MDYDLAIYTTKKLDENRFSGLEIKCFDDQVRLFKSYENVTQSLEELIFDFIGLVQAYGKDMFCEPSVLQVGAYYSIESSATFTVRLGPKLLGDLAGRGVSIEVSSYPCEE